MTGSFDFALARTSSSRTHLVVAVVVVALCAVYFVGVVLFSFVCYPNTKVLGSADVSWRPTVELPGVVGEAIDDMSVRVRGAGLDFEVDAVDAGASVANDGALSGAMLLSRNPWLWFVEAWGDHELLPDGLDVAGVAIDEEALSRRVSPFVDEFNESAEPPHDAQVVRDDEKKAFVVEKESVGTALDSATVCGRVREAVLSCSDVAEVDDDCLLQPAVRATDDVIVERAKRANDMASLEIPLLVDGEEVSRVGQDTLFGWVRVTGEGVSVDAEAATSWARGELSSRYDTVGTARSYTLPDGTSVEVPAGDGTYGWNVDGAALAETLSSHVTGLDASGVEIPFRSRGASFVQGGRDWPARYVDVNLSAQHATLFDGDGVVWESECVSGNTSNGHGTPSGVFFVEYKASPMVLVGADEDHDGQPDYRTPVDYWMPFYNGCGLHDATWRSSFGGSIYSYDGSHGCVNLPYGKAQELYGLLSEGDVVVVHW